MSDTEYGLKPKGPNIKRLDVVIDEISESLLHRWGFDPRDNPESYLNVLITDFADKIAELWEFGEQVYWSQYPSSAEGINLDNVAQIGGITREPGMKSVYQILCTGTDGLTIPQGTRIRTNRNPTTVLRNARETDIRRSHFNKARIKPSGSGLDFRVKVSSGNENIASASATSLEGLVSALTVEDVLTAVLEDEFLKLEAVQGTDSFDLFLSDDLTTEDVSTIMEFYTEEDGDIFIPNGTAVIIVDGVRTDNGSLDAVTNVGTYIPGRLIETDSELRKSYADKIFLRSYSMIESIRSAILAAVPEITHCAVYQNDTNSVDDAGRPPHSVEVVVSGISDDDETNIRKVAETILATKAAGISTFGYDPNDPDPAHHGKEVEIVTEGGETIVIRFNFPSEVAIYFEIEVTYSAGVSSGDDKAAINAAIESSIVSSVTSLDVGDDVNPQRWIPQVEGADYLDIKIGKSSAARNQRMIAITEREKATTMEANITISEQNTSEP